MSEIGSFLPVPVSYSIERLYAIAVSEAVRLMRDAKILDDNAGYAEPMNLGNARSFREHAEQLRKRAYAIMMPYRTCNHERALFQQSRIAQTRVELTSGN